MTGRFRGGARFLAAALTLAAVAAVAVAASGWLRRARSPVAVDLDVPYAMTGRGPIRLDVYRPRGATTPRPAILLIHGGGWVGGDKAEQADMADHFARAGFVAFAVNYRLATDDASRYPAPVDDVQRAVRWVRAHAREYGVDPARVGAFGHSAGGHLAASLGTRETRDDSDPALAGYSSRVSCVVDCCGPADFTTEESPPVGPSIADVVPSLFGRTRPEAPEAYRDASPVTHADARSAPTLIVHGTADDIVPIDQSRRLLRALREAGVEARLVELEGEGHGFESPANVRIWLAEMMAFFRLHLKP